MMIQRSLLKKKQLRFVLWYFGVNALYFILIGLGYLKATFQIHIFFANASADDATIWGAFFNIGYWTLYYLSYMPLLAYLPALPLLVIAYFIPYKKLLFPLCVCVALFCLLLLVLDSRVFSMFNFHLNQTLVSLFFDGRWNDVFGFSAIELWAYLILMGVFLGLEVWTARFVWRNIIMPERYRLKHPLFTYWFGILLFCNLGLLGSMQRNHHLPQQTINFPLCYQLIAALFPGIGQDSFTRAVVGAYTQERPFSDDPMRYPRHAMQCQKPSHPYNIIFILVDSLRFDSLSPNDMPKTTAFAAQNWQFLKHVSGGNCTQAGLFSLFYSIPSNYWTAASKQKIPPVLMQLFSQNDYSTGVFWASPLKTPSFDKTIYQTVANHPNFYTSIKNNIGDRDRDVTRHAIDFLQEHNHKQPFFLNVFYDAAHSYCLQQNFNTPNLDAHEPCFRFMRTNQTDPSIYYNRYRNAVHFLDGEIAQLLNSIKQEGYFDNSIIVISSDHGEEFNDSKHNVWGHASDITQSQTHIPLIIHWPGEGPKTFDYVTTSYDLAPTLLQKLFACGNEVTDYSIGQNLLSEQRKDPYPVIVGGYVNVGYIEAERLTTLYASGTILTTDPKLNPIPHAEPNLSTLKQVLNSMRMYYVQHS